MVNWLSLEPTPSTTTWNPQEHPIEAQLLSFEPGRELIYEQGQDKAGHVMMTLLMLAMGWLVGRFFHAGLIGLLTGLALSAMYIGMMWQAGSLYPVRWRFSFPEEELHITAGGESFSYELQDVTRVRLVLERQEQSWSSSLSGVWQKYEYARYNAQTVLDGLLEGSELVIANTGFFQRDPELVRESGSHFAQMIAQELRVPLEIDDSILPKELRLKQEEPEEPKAAEYLM